MFDRFKVDKPDSAGDLAQPEIPLPVESPLATIDKMAAEMNPEQAVWWACKSTEKVAGETAAEDVNAAKAAEAWVKNPSVETQQLAAQAAKSLPPGPGALAAQAAALAPAADAADAAAGIADAASEGLASTVAGAVKLAAAMDAAPAEVKALTANVPSIDAPSVAAPGLSPPEVPMVSAADAWAKLPKPDAQKTLQAYQPFIDLGKAIMEGKNHWA